MENEANNKNKKYDESRVYYVYKHVRLDNNTCFYIGKGKNGRKDDPNRNSTHDSICDRYGYKVVIFKDKLNEAEAFKLEEDLINNSVWSERRFGGNVSRYKSFISKLSKNIIHSIDKELNVYYGFTDEELDFIINYDIKYRMGDELNEGE